MADLQNKPIINTSPAETHGFPQGMVAVLEALKRSIENVLPAKIVTYDRTKNLAVVQPMIMLVDTSDNTRSRRTISNIPVLSLGAGGFHINFPAKQGDLGWLVAADRDISLFLSSLAESGPPQLRTHSFVDSLFIPDVFGKYTINAEDSAAMVIQSTDGTTRISIGNGTVNITAPSSVKVTTPTATFSQDVVIEGNLTVDKNAVVTGQTSVNGGLDASGSGSTEVTLPSNTTINGIVVINHGHEQNGDSGRTSGGMEQ